MTVTLAKSNLDRVLDFMRLGELLQVSLLVQEFAGGENDNLPKCPGQQRESRSPSSA
jgi:hypothetical protein